MRRAAAGILVVVVLVAVGIVVLRPSGPPPATATPGADVTTAAVESGDVTTESTYAGTLGYPGAAPILAGADGVLTSVPRTGETRAPGDVLYTVDARPVVLLRGTMPPYRTFERGMAPGFDVLQLQRNLAAFGLYGGVLDGRFSPGTVAAVRGWQHRLGLAPTGRLERGSIVFGRGVLRVAGRRAALGAPLTAGAEVVSTSAVGQVVRTDVPLEDRAAVRPGQRARVELPGGRTTTGRVVRVGAPRQRTTDQGTTVVLPTTLHLRNRRAGVPYDGARVTVRIQSRPRPDRLTVPVAALVALGPDAFGVEVPRRSGASRRVPVRVGTFSAGRVEISGAGIRPGLRVVVGAE